MSVPGACVSMQYYFFMGFRIEFLTSKPILVEHVGGSAVFWGESYLRMYFTQPCKSQQAVMYSGTHRKLCSNQKSPSWQLGPEGRFLFSSHDTWRRPCLSASLGILVLRTHGLHLCSPLPAACRLHRETDSGRARAPLHFPPPSTLLLLLLFLSSAHISCDMFFGLASEILFTTHFPSLSYPHFWSCCSLPK